MGHSPIAKCHQCLFTSVKAKSFFFGCLSRESYVERSVARINFSHNLNGVMSLREGGKREREEGVGEDIDEQKTYVFRVNINGNMGLSR